jgi:hypothetical protein
VTPGFAKSRKELFWLPYPESDKVIINAHNFTPAGPGMIGDEIGVWSPTWDDSGNGTTTLNDLVGSDDGVLTNMDAASDWVSDTASGGVRALDFDGSNDFVAVTRASTTPAELTLMAWVKTTASGSRRGIIAFGTMGENAYIDLMPTGIIRCAVEANNSLFNFRDSAGAVNTGSWFHVAMTATISTVKVYVNGVDVTTGGGSGGSSSSLRSRSITIGKGLGGAYGGHYSGLIDTCRLYHRALSASEVATNAASRGY